MDDTIDQLAAEHEVSEHGRKLMGIIDFAYQVKQLLDGPIGKRLAADTENERAELVESLVDCDPDVPADLATIRRIRQRIGICDHWQQLFVKYITDGEQAESEFERTEATSD